MNFRGAIFDLDGTLLDSMWVWRKVDDTYIRNKGMIPEPDLSRKLATKNMAQSVEYFQEVYGIHEPADQMAADLWGLAEDAYRHEVTLKPKTAEFLQQLQKRGIRSVVATASDKAFTKAALERCGVADCFEAILTCDEIGFGKDHPDVFLAAQQLLNLPKEEILVFEDSLHAMQTAKQAGFLVVALEDVYALPDKEQILQIADCYLHDFGEWDFEKEMIR